MRRSGPPSPRITAPGAPLAKAQIQVPEPEAASTLPTMFRQIGTGEIILIVVVLVFLFGAKKIPELARSIGKSARELRKGLKDGLDDEDDPDA